METKLQDHNWILLRGLTRESGHWGEFAEKLKQSAGEDNVHLLDLPGAGENLNVTSPFDLKQIVKFIREQAKQRGLLEKPIMILSISLGSMLAIEWERSFPEDIEGLVLINTSLRGFNSLGKRLQPKAWPLFAKAVLSRTIKQKEAAILELVANDSSIREKYLDSWVEIAEKRPLSLENSFRQLVAAALYNPSKQAPKVPILFLNSLGDQLCHSSCSEKLNKVWGGDIATHQSSGHDLTLEEPDWVLLEVNKWLFKTVNTGR